MSKIVALDYDNTVTSNLPLMNSMVSLLKSEGYEVIIVTRRNLEGDNRDLEEFAEKHGLNCIFSEGLQKKQVCEGLGVFPSIWVDDYPGGIPNHTELSSEYSRSIINNNAYGLTIERNKNAKKTSNKSRR
jgi:hypothetical protein